MKCLKFPIFIKEANKFLKGFAKNKEFSAVSHRKNYQIISKLKKQKNGKDVIVSKGYRRAVSFYKYVKKYFQVEIKEEKYNKSKARKITNSDDVLVKCKKHKITFISKMRYLKDKTRCHEDCELCLRELGLSNKNFLDVIGKDLKKYSVPWRLKKNYFGKNVPINLVVGTEVELGIYCINIVNDGAECKL